MKSSTFSDERGSYFRQHRSWRRRARFWLIATLLCAVGGGLAFSLYWIFESAPPFLYGPYKELQQRDFEVMDREFRKLEHEEKERIKRVESFRERRGDEYGEVYRRGSY
jgi:hypothetical protein